MTRSLIALLVVGLSATSAQGQGQGSGCTYDTCALRLGTRFLSSPSIVQGHEGRRVAKIGMFGTRVDVLAGGSDSVRTHYEAFRHHRNSGGALNLISALAEVGLTILVLC
jgi:hypothetical protein